MRLDRVPVPGLVLLTLAGALFGLVPGVPHPAIPVALLLALALVLILQAAMTTDQAQLRHLVRPVVLLATVGVGLTCAIVGLGAHYLLGLGWHAAFLLGAIVAPTDPVAVVALVRRLGASARLVAVLEGESLLNDGTGAAVFLAVALSASFTGFAAGLLLQTVVGIAAGALLGAVGARAARGAAERPALLLAGLAAFLVASPLGGSGVLAVVAAGVVASRLLPPSAAPLGRHADGILNGLLFLLVGIAIPLQSVLISWLPVAVAYLLMLAARAVAVYPLVTRSQLPWRWQHLAWWGGLRGGLAMTLALSAGDHRVTVLAAGMILLALLVQGGLLRVITKRLQAAKP
ncbi:MAG: hypothetical protein NVS9B1_01070 [Candidatus Dormibacteraceae bacterium]